VADLTDIISRLLAAEVDFVVIGGLAAVTYGSPVMTHDIDVCCDFSTENLMRLKEALAGIHPVRRMTTKPIPLSLTPDFCKGLKNLYLDTDLGQLDCLSQVRGVGGFRDAIKNSEQIEIDGYTCHVLRLETLIASKQSMGREKDLETVRHLRAIQDRLGWKGGAVQ